MKFWATIQIACWASAAAVCSTVVYYIYQIAYDSAVTSAAQRMHVTPDCERNCMQSDSVNVLTDVIPVTVVGAIMIVTAFISFYLYLRPSLKVVAELSKQ